MGVLTKRILAWVSFGAGVIILAFFRNYHGTVIPYPWLIYVFGILCFICGFLLLRKTPTANENKMYEKAKAFINDLKENGDRLAVELNNCEIKENHYYQEPDNFKNASDMELATAMDLIYLYNKLNIPPTDNQTYQSVAVFKQITKETSGHLIPRLLQKIRRVFFLSLALKKQRFCM